MADPAPSSSERVAARRRFWLIVVLGVVLVSLPIVPAPPALVGPISASLMRPNGGYAYSVDVRELQLGAPLLATGAELREDGKPLRVDHMHSDIRGAGRGRYSPWGWTLYFSATDNSDPRTNNRAYVLILRRSLLERFAPAAAWSRQLALLSAATGVFLLCFGLTRAASPLARSLSRGVLRSSPFDVRCILRLALAYVAWRQASADYEAIPRLMTGVDLHALAPSALNQLASGLKHALLDHPTKLVLMQSWAVLASLLAVVFLRRWTLAVALLPTLIIEWAAYHYRGQLPDLDPMLAVLLIAACWPASWSAVTRRSRAPSPDATALGLALAAYIGGVYFISGWSKVVTDGPWWRVIHLDMLYAAMVVWMGAAPPDWLDPIARGLQRLFARWPALGEWSALGTMILELTWPLALLSRSVRLAVPAMMLAAHAVIFLASGILFLPLALIGIGVVFPWRWFAPGADVPTSGDQSPIRYWMVWPVAGALALAVLPAQHSADVFPFSNYQHFNWNHSTLLEPSVAHRLGYRDQRTGELLPVPLNHGGFMDCWSVSLAGREVEQYLQAGTPEQRAASRARLLQYARALRPHRSSFRLGWISCPPHVLGSSQAVPVRWFDELHLLRGEFPDPRRSLETQWVDCGRLPGWPEPE